MARRVLINALSLTQGGGRSYVTNVLRELERDDRGFRFTVLVSPGQLNSTVGSKLDVETAKLPASAARSRVLARVGYEEAVLPFRARRFDLLYCLADLAPALRSTPTVVALRNLNIYDRRFYDTARLRILERLVRVFTILEAGICRGFHPRKQHLCTTRFCPLDYPAEVFLHRLNRLAAQNIVGPKFQYYYLYIAFERPIDSPEPARRGVA